MATSTSMASTSEIEDGAVISGSLHYRSDREAEIASGATIGGDVEFTRSETPRRMVGIAFAIAGMTVLRRSAD